MKIKSEQFKRLPTIGKRYDLLFNITKHVFKNIRYSFSSAKSKDRSLEECARLKRKKKKDIVYQKYTIVPMSSTQKTKGMKKKLLLRKKFFRFTEYFIIRLKFRLFIQVIKGGKAFLHHNLIRSV